MPARSKVREELAHGAAVRFTTDEERIVVPAAKHHEARRTGRRGGETPGVRRREVLIALAVKDEHGGGHVSQLPLRVVPMADEPADRKERVHGLGDIGDRCERRLQDEAARVGFGWPTRPPRPRRATRRTAPPSAGRAGAPRSGAGTQPRHRGRCRSTPACPRCAHSPGSRRRARRLRNPSGFGSSRGGERCGRRSRAGGSRPGGSRSAPAPWDPPVG